MVKIRVITTAGRRYFVKNVFISRFLLQPGWCHRAKVTLTRSLFHPLALQGQMQHLQDQVDGFDADEWDDDTSDAVDQEVAAQERTCPDRAVFDPSQGQWDQRDDD